MSLTNCAPMRYNIPKSVGRISMFVNETRNDTDFNVKVSMFTSKKTRILITAVCVPLFIALGVGLLFLDDTDIFFPVFLFVFAGVMLLFMLLGFKPLVRALIKRSTDGKTFVNFYTFREDGYDIRSTDNSGTESELSGSYSGLVKVTEQNDFWLLYYNKTTYFAVSKYGMKEGSAQDLSDFFGMKLGNRYFPVGKNK